MNRLRWWLVSGAGIPWSLRIGTRVSSTHPTGQRACRRPANFIVAGQPELLAHQRGAAADGALVHRQGTGSLGLRSGEFQQVEHMQVLQVLQGLGWGVGREVTP